MSFYSIYRFIRFVLCPVVDMNWDVLINMKINKYLNATLNTTLKYDNDVKTINDEGEKRGAKVQFKDILGIGVAYNF